jgi:DNA processing protein
VNNLDDPVVRARLVLSWVTEPGSRKLWQLVAEHGPVEALDRLVKGDAHPALADAAHSRFNNASPAQIAGELTARAQSTGSRIITPESADWPAGLADLAAISSERNRYDRDTYPPHVLWLRGPMDLATLARGSVALVGGRDASRYGLHVAADLAFGLASRGWPVVSGGAFGVDAAAHRGALAAGGATVSVLACGVDRPYPAAHTALFEQIAEQGLLISEWPPGSAPHKHRFLIRNRVIAALTRGTVMIEAGLRSGSRQTLRRARQLGRASMAVPGPVTADSFAGSHEELRRTEGDRVRLVTCVAHVLEEVGPIGELAPIPRGPVRASDQLSDLEQQLVDAAPIRGSMTAAELAAQAGVGLLDALAALPSLALRGFVRRTPEGRYALNL